MCSVYQKTLLFAVYMPQLTTFNKSSNGGSVLEGAKLTESKVRACESLILPQLSPGHRGYITICEIKFDKKILQEHLISSARYTIANYEQ